MAQPCAIALHAVRQSLAKPGDTVALIGVGGIGSFLLAALHSVGVTSIIALDVEQERLATAMLLGATRVLLVREDALGASSARRLLTDSLGADVVIEASGAP